MSDPALERARAEGTAGAGPRAPEVGLEEALAQLQLAIETAQLGIWRHELEGDRVYWNDQQLAIYGLTREVFTADPDAWTERLHPEDREVTLGHFEALYEGHPVSHLEFRIVRPDRQVRHISASGRPLRDDSGAVVGVTGINIDVTAVKEREAQLAQSEAFLRAIFERSRDAIVVADDGGRCVAANPAAAQLLGVATPAALDGADVTALGLAGAQDPAGVFARFLERGEAVGEVTLERGDGERLCRFSATRIAPDVNVNVLTDVTEQRELEQQLRQAQKMDSLGQFAGGIAHDFNNLLMVVLANLREHRREALDARELEIAEEAAERAAQLTRRLLAFARRQPLKPARLDLAQLLRTTEEMLCLVLPDSIVLRVVSDAPEALVRGDAGQLEQVVTNLLLNARDAMGGRGEIDVRLSSREHGERGPGYTIDIDDLGPGVPPDLRARIFEPFFTTKGPEAGSGLGLSVAHGIVAQHGGELSVLAAPGGGARFRVWLPADPDVQEEVPTTGPRDSDAFRVLPPAEGIRVLIADDHAAVRATVSLLLRRAGFEVLEAADGQEALERVRAADPPVDVAVLDVVMPRATGPEVRAALAADPATADLPVIYSSGDLEPRSTEGDAPILIKPYDMDELVAAIRLAVSRRR